MRTPRGAILRQKTNLKNGVTLECNRKLSSKPFFHVHINVISLSTCLGKEIHALKSISKKTRFHKNCKKAYKFFMILFVTKIRETFFSSKGTTISIIEQNSHVFKYIDMYIDKV